MRVCDFLFIFFPQGFVCRELIYGMKGQWVMAKYKRWSLPLSQAASSFLCDLWCLLPLPKGGRAKLLSTGRTFESHPREKGEKPPLHSPNTETRASAKTRRLCASFTTLLCPAFCTNVKKKKKKSWWKWFNCILFMGLCACVASMCTNHLFFPKWFITKVFGSFETNCPE